MGQVSISLPVRDGPRPFLSSCRWGNLDRDATHCLRDGRARTKELRRWSRLSRYGDVKVGRLEVRWEGVEMVRWRTSARSPSLIADALLYGVKERRAEQTFVLCLVDLGHVGCVACVCHTIG